MELIRWSVFSAMILFIYWMGNQGIHSYRYSFAIFLFAILTTALVIAMRFLIKKDDIVKLIHEIEEAEKLELEGLIGEGEDQNAEDRT